MPSTDPMDNLSQHLFGQPRNTNFRTATGNLDLERFLLEHQTRINSVLGQPLSVQDVLDVLGFPNGTTIQSCLTYANSDQLSIRLEAKHDELGIGRIEELLLVEADEPTIVLDLLILQRTNTGIGSRLFAHQVHRARQLGFRSIVLEAVRGPTMYGYFFWPQLGFDGPLGTLRSSVARTFERLTGNQLPEEVETVQDLLSLEFGDEVWEQAGNSLPLEFDLAPDSASKALLEDYLRFKEIRLAELW